MKHERAAGALAKRSRTAEVDSFDEWQDDPLLELERIALRLPHPIADDGSGRAHLSA
jgi:hypothetical protein